MKSTILAIVIAFVATTADAAPRVSRYEQCLTALIKARGMAYAVNHAGSTACDKH